ncbi:hypothetical protein N7448_006627 [Penicillium atrosanguineum]|uniref:Gfd2/YDR514C-like C-terminal domain-containing protein n=1 Tax=Penicillium atrosanguineum TaxID=1132637 RepID=A0A9W9L2R3_9EURO|nr:plasma membrane proteolipid 3 [Penicillium atrosanguineum]KAJ5132469.1 hypothetical protein N7448_006627 [Penicillium atrosanguineum]KAJ5290136.1 plasma membrane proteolipid 3 [Penicillium atrosanguineum]KAJ5307960.1 hypothetical protein N7476_008616 [Penicillium atrosanguineum]
MGRKRSNPKKGKKPRPKKTMVIGARRVSDPKPSYAFEDVSSSVHSRQPTKSSRDDSTRHADVRLQNDAGIGKWLDTHDSHHVRIDVGSSQDLVEAGPIPGLTAENIAGYWCPIMALARFPNTYIGGRDKELTLRLLAYFFHEEKFWCRPWKQYYLKIPFTHPGGGRLTLARAEDVLAFLKEANAKEHCDLTLDGKVGMLLHFDGSDGSPIPTELGTTKSRSDKEKLLGVTLPLGSWDAWMEDQPLSVTGPFFEKLLAGMQAARNNRGPKQKQRMDHQIAHQIKYSTALERVVCIFGLHPTTFVMDLPPVSLLEAPRFDMEGEYIFVSVDVEWKDHITELGISFLDTLDLVNLPPGEDGVNWSKMIKSHHLRTGENCKHDLWKRGSSCPKKFGFGQSENLSVNQLGARIDRLFSPPYGHHVGDIPEYKLRRRSLILVGHGMAGDMTQLAKTGSKVFNGMDLPLPAITKVWDTNWLWRVMRRTTNARSLRDTLVDLDVGLVSQAPFHNGGNDAHYTMLALLRIVLIAASSPTGWAKKAKPPELTSRSTPFSRPGPHLAPTSRHAVLYTGTNLISSAGLGLTLSVSSRPDLILPAEYDLISSPPFIPVFAGPHSISSDDEPDPPASVLEEKEDGAGGWEVVSIGVGSIENMEDSVELLRL